MCRKKKTTVLNCVKWVKNVYVWNPGKKIILSGTTEKNWVKRNGKSFLFDIFFLCGTIEIFCVKQRKIALNLFIYYFFSHLFFLCLSLTSLTRIISLNFVIFLSVSEKMKSNFRRKTFFFFFSWELLFHVWIRVKILVIPMFKTSTGKMSLTKRSSVG